MVRAGPKTSLRTQRSKSGLTLAPGLYLVATPIGNARDITLRALEVLTSADMLFAEDTRVTSKLLALHAISRSLQSYREQNAITAGRQILDELEQNRSVALVSDAGTPLISDPGASLVELVVQRGFTVYPVPGPSAAIAALTAAGLPSDRFFFAGFLPTKTNERRRAIRELESVPGTLIFYEAPGRVGEALIDLAAILGNRPASVARELTKMHEEFRRNTLNELANYYQTNPDVKGEIVIVVAPPSTTTPTLDGDELDRRLKIQLGTHPVKDASAIVAAELGLSRRTVYARALELKKANDT